ncbi:cytochrome c maturation protein CcmE [Rhabdothermincola salaria]|uniref:cytochrome c maturation protein CcmE n=1 Tax=Rhabdothermincola salaria TaxID=2903142 RepID=UPI001E322990|nr:cytochrome c maturation protein CcmE [Rhabdothermincola salaria]
MELTPRTGPSAAPGETAGPGLAPEAPRRPGSTRAKLPVIAVIVAIVAVGAFVLVNALGNATLFFYNADEAVERQEELGTDRFRLQGTVIGPSVVRTDDGVSFDVTFNGVEVPVQHFGDPPELFQPDIPVVLEGRFAEGPDGELSGPANADGAPLFLSDRMLVKHDENYKAKEGDRLEDAEEGGDVSSGSGEPTVAEGETGQAGTS